MLRDREVDFTIDNGTATINTVNVLFKNAHMLKSIFISQDKTYMTATLKPVDYVYIRPPYNIFGETFNDKNIDKLKDEDLRITTITEKKIFFGLITIRKGRVIKEPLRYGWHLPKEPGEEFTITSNNFNYITN